MIVVIYKLTIVSKVKMDGYKPFYIGQHYCLDDNDVSKFVDRSFVNYYGSGKIWNDFISSLKKRFLIIIPPFWFICINLTPSVYLGKPVLSIAISGIQMSPSKRET